METQQTHRSLNGACCVAPTTRTRALLAPRRPDARTLARSFVVSALRTECNRSSTCSVRQLGVTIRLRECECRPISDAIRVNRATTRAPDVTRTLPVTQRPGPTPHHDPPDLPCHGGLPGWVPALVCVIPTVAQHTFRCARGTARSDLFGHRDPDRTVHIGRTGREVLHRNRA
jgi:hypothetical protein